jgi:uncharacterized protein YecE (DUF72 family)
MRFAGEYRFAMTEIRLGTSGWSYPEWRTSLYDGVPQRRWLARYSAVFNAVEANITYRRDLSGKAAATWIEETEDGFRFAIKAHQRATHFHRLKTPDDDIPLQVAQADLVGRKLGVVYFQLPHNFLRDDVLLDAYLAAWPKRIPTVWEFLHTSWHEPEVDEVLRRHHAGWVISDAKNPVPEPTVTGPDAYVRLRAATYDPEHLRRWATLIRGIDSDRVWVFVRHGADAPQLAERLGDLVLDGP